MELRDYLDILRRRWVTAVAVAVAVLTATTVLTLLLPQKFTATNRLFFSVQSAATGSDLAQGSTFASNQIASYAEVATSPIVLDPVIDELGLGVSAADLAKVVTATVPTRTVIVSVAVVDPSPQQAMRIANAIGAELARVVTELSPEQKDGSQSVKATILTPASLPLTPSSPNVARNLLIGSLLAVVLGIGAALLRNMLDTKIRNESDLRLVSDAALLGSVAFDESVPSHPVVVADEPLSAPSEAVRRLRTNIQFIGEPDQSKKIVITSSVSGEGKTTTAVNVAVALADAGSRVILIDADLRRPSVAERMGLEGAAGLTTVLIGRADWADVIQPWRSNGLDVLASGQIPPNPSELLGSHAMIALLDQLSEIYDVILLDTPPLLPVTDATILTKLAGGALVVVGADRIHRRQLHDSLETLATADAQVYGLTLNKVAKRDVGPDGYRGGYYRTKADAIAASIPPVGSADEPPIETVAEPSPVGATRGDRTWPDVRW